MSRRDSPRLSWQSSNICLPLLLLTSPRWNRVLPRSRESKHLRVGRKKRKEIEEIPLQKSPIYGITRNTVRKRDEPKVRKMLKRDRSMRQTLMREEGGRRRGLVECLYTSHLYGILSRHADLKRLLRTVVGPAGIVPS